MQQALFGFDPAREWDYENGFYLTSHVKRMAKLAAHYDLYKSITGLPGELVECGVYKGASLIRFATFREILESPFSRRIIGFDAFGRFPQPAQADDREFVERFERDGGDGIPLPELERVLAHKALTNVELIQGDILETVPRYAADHPELRIALLHVDVDVYGPSATVLREFSERVVRGGIVVLDDYATVAGETRAVDELLAVTPGLIVEKLPMAHVPAFIRKR